MNPSLSNDLALRIAVPRLRNSGLFRWGGRGPAFVFARTFAVSRRSGCSCPVAAVKRQRARWLLLHWMEESAEVRFGRSRFVHSGKANRSEPRARNTSQSSQGINVGRMRLAPPPECLTKEGVARIEEDEKQIVEKAVADLPPDLGKEVLQHGLTTLVEWEALGHTLLLRGAFDAVKKIADLGWAWERDQDWLQNRC